MCVVFELSTRNGRPSSCICVEHLKRLPRKLHQRLSITHYVEAKHQGCLLLYCEIVNSGRIPRKVVTRFSVVLIVIYLSAYDGD